MLRSSDRAIVETVLLGVILSVGEESAFQGTSKNQQLLCRLLKTSLSMLTLVLNCSFCKGLQIVQMGVQIDFELPLGYDASRRDLGKYISI